MKLDLKGIDSTMQLMTRRTMLKDSIAIMAAATSSGMLTEALWAEPLVKLPGIQLYTVGKELNDDVEGTLKKIRTIGYREVETAGFAGDTAKQFRTALENADLMCHSCHFFNFGSADPGPLFDEANTLGVHYTVSSGISKFTQKPDGTGVAADDYKAMAEFCNNLGQMAEQAGLQFAYHNHNFEFKDLGNGKVGYDIFLENSDPDLVKLELDCGWMIAAGKSPVHYFQRYPNRYRMVHIKDFIKPAHPSTSLAPRNVPQGTVLGTGYIDYRPILKAALAAGVEHFYVEQEPPFIGMTSLVAAERDYAYLQALSA
jgi:sugar phosphate isomerase/epimerase